MKKIIWMVVLQVLLSTAYAELAVQLQTSQVQIGETFALTLSNDDPQAGSLPDLTPLKQDFTIVGTERSMNYTIINGQTQSLSQWTIMLMPKRPGVLTIPAIRMGQEQTLATSIKVTTTQPISSQSIDQPQDVMLNVDVSDEKPFVNQQVIYTVRIYLNRRLFDAQFQNPTVEDALLLPLGKSNRYQTLVNNVVYQIDEQKFAIVPQKSGKLTIKPPVFNALIADTAPKKISITAKPVVLHVRPVPAQFAQKAWLPAKQVELSETYEPSSTSLKQGDTLVRNVTLQATGVAAQLMPALDFGQSDQYSIYPEQPIEKTTYVQQDLVGTTTVKVTYLLNNAGKIEIPELKLPWFNTATGQTAIASLPARSIEVQAVAGMSTVSNKSAQETTQTSLPVKNKDTASQASAVKYDSRMGWWLASLFALAWIITLILWWRRQGVTRNHAHLSIVNKKLKAACLTNQPQAAKEALLEWAGCIWPKTKCLNLADITRLVGQPGFKKQINVLSQTLYQQDQQSWQGDDLWQCIVNFKPNGTSGKNKENPLPPIHPSSS